MRITHRLIWRSPTPWNKGSAAQDDLASTQANFYKTLTADYGVMFSGNQAIINSLRDASTAIFAGGIDQYGFSPTEDTARRTAASDAIAQNFSQAQTALNENLASRGGGNVFLPSGASAQLEAGLFGEEATQQATASNQITQEGYATGRQNFLSAAGILGQTAGLNNPASILGGTNQAGSDAFGSATTLYNQGNIMGMVGGILGGAAGDVVSGATGGLLGMNNPVSNFFK